MEFLVTPRWRGGPQRSSLLFQRNEACIGARSSWFLYELLTSSSRILTNLLHIIRCFFFEMSSPKIVWRSRKKLTKLWRHKDRITEGLCIFSQLHSVRNKIFYFICFIIYLFTYKYLKNSQNLNIYLQNSTKRKIPSD